MVSAQAPGAPELPGPGAAPDAAGKPDCVGGPGDRGLGTRWLDAEERDAWLGLLRVTARLPSLLDAQLERQAGVTLFEYTILAMLSEQPDLTLRMSRLAAVTNASPSRLSHAARHLESRGWLRREADPGDGRGIRAVLTPAGHGLVVDAAPGHVATVRGLVFDALDPSLTRALVEVNRRILLRVDPSGTSDPGRPPGDPSRDRPAPAPDPPAGPHPDRSDPDRSNSDREGAP
jgi:DNA-binding MarR family transcriptional regulator